MYRKVANVLNNMVFSLYLPALLSPIEPYVIHSPLPKAKVLERVTELFFSIQKKPFYIPPAQNNGYYSGRIDGDHFHLSHLAIAGPGAPKISGSVTQTEAGSRIELTPIIRDSNFARLRYLLIYIPYCLLILFLFWNGSWFGGLWCLGILVGWYYIGRSTVKKFYEGLDVQYEYLSNLFCIEQ